MSKGSQDARRLERLLEARAGHRLGVRRDADHRGWRWWVSWSDGPIEASMRGWVGELADQVPALDVDQLVYAHNLSRQAWAVQLVRWVAAGGELRADPGYLTWQLTDLRQEFLAVADPARPVDADEEERAEALLRLAGEGWEERMAEILRDHGLGALVTPDASNVVPFGPRPRGAR